MDRQEVLELLQDHRSRFPEESAYVARARTYLAHQSACFDRRTLPLHVTASAWIVSPQRGHVLLLHHRKHGQWFQPGGHIDDDASALEAALREGSEETGVAGHHLRPVLRGLFDVDIHRIPAHGPEPAHGHIDIRFLLELDHALPIPGNAESHDVRWVPLWQVKLFNHSRSAYRMVEKTRRLRGSHISAR